MSVSFFDPPSNGMVFGLRPVSWLADIVPIAFPSGLRMPFSVAV
jgi:hypothetical protein